MATLREQKKDLLDQRAKAWGEVSAKITEAAEAGEPLNGENLEFVERGQATIQSMTSTMEALDAQIALEGTMARTIEDVVLDQDGNPKDQRTSADEYNDIFKRFLISGMDELEPEERQTLRGRAHIPQKGTPEARALGILQGQTGGYTVPEGFWARISEVQKWYGGVDQLGANEITTMNGADLPWATNDDTGNVGALLGENVQVTDLDVSFGARVLSAHTYTTRQIKVSLQLLQDSAFDIESFIVKKFGQRLGRVHNRDFTNGTGIAQPQGYITGLTKTLNVGVNDVISYTDVLGLTHTVDPAYRYRPGVKLVFHDKVLQSLQALVDSQQRPLWLPSVRDGVPDTFLGYPYVINNDMVASTGSAAAAGSCIMAFGDFEQGYVVRKVKGATMIRLDERYADFLQVGFLGFDRVDGMVDDPNAIAGLLAI